MDNGFLKQCLEKLLSRHWDDWAKRRENSKGEYIKNMVGSWHAAVSAAFTDTPSASQKVFRGRSSPVDYLWSSLKIIALSLNSFKYFEQQLHGGFCYSALWSVHVAKFNSSKLFYYPIIFILYDELSYTLLTPGLFSQKQLRHLKWCSTDKDPAPKGSHFY